MNSQTHIIMGAALFGRKTTPLAWAGAAGGLVPDLPMYAIFAALKLAGYSSGEIFGRFYWNDGWQIANAVGHNFLLWSGVLALSLFAMHRAPATANAAGWPAISFAFSGSALLHSAIDFLCHRNDAHMHFWPLTDWRFRSPVSYWDPQHYGNWFSAFEFAVGLSLAIILYRRYRNRFMRIAMALVMIAYIAVPAYFIFLVEHH